MKVAVDSPVIDKMSGIYDLRDPCGKRELADMPALPAAPLDRRIKVLARSPADAQEVGRVSALRAWPYVVVLGEPGMGKSTVLGQEAQAAQTNVVTVRAFLEGAALAGGVPAFLDGLDEFRSDRGQRADKIERLATRLQALSLPGWWLSCRAEDWSDADREALERAAAPGQIVVARLETLDEQEARAILAAMGEADPGGFRARAERLGGTAFLENPLSIELLVRATRDTGEWPSTRFALFEIATQRLAHEYDPRRGRDIQRDPVAAIRAARRICALLLLANRGAIWHSLAPPTAGADGQSYLPAYGLGLDQTALANTLDTALFRQTENDLFEPMHRVVAEFLAGSALAVAIAGGPGQPRYPLSRALALIAGADGRAPSDLRGVYAWTATHLSRLGLHADAERMIRQDAVSVLIYGDAGALNTPERRALLAHLDRQDPWFRESDEGDTAVGGLAGEDLATEFETILRQTADPTHRFLTVTEALTFGSPVPSLSSLLREIALDPSRPAWQRQRIADAWIASSVDKTSARLDLYRAASALPQTEGTVALRVMMAGKLPGDLLADCELDQLLVDHYRMAEKRTVGRLMSLGRQLQGSPRRRLLERDWAELLNQQPASSARIEVERLLDQNFAAVLCASPMPDGEDVWRWLTKRNRFSTGSPDEVVRRALQAWLTADPQHGVDLFQTIAVEAKDPPPRWPTLVYLNNCGVLPSLPVVVALLDAGLWERIGKSKCLSMAAAAVGFDGADPACQRAVDDYLQRQPANTDKAALLALVENHDFHAAQRQMAMQAAAECEERQHELMALREQFERAAAGIRDGTELELLEVAARYRFGQDHAWESIEPGLDRVHELLGSELANAVVSGWRHVMENGFQVTPVELGQAAGRNESYLAESSVLAWTDQMLVQRLQNPAGLPLVAALVVLKSVWMADEDKAASARLVQWALERLKAGGSAGSEALRAMWSASLDAGAGRRAELPGLWLLREHAGTSDFAAPALRELLRSRPTMPVEALGSTLETAARTLPPADLRELAQHALESGQDLGPSRDLWLCVGFALDPCGYRADFMSHFGGRRSPLPRDQYQLMETLAATLATSRIIYAETAFRLFAARGNPAGVEPWSSSPARASLDWLRDSADPLATIAMRGLATEPTLADWHSDIRHALAVQARQRLDRRFVPASVAAIQAALLGGAPVNGADLQAVVVDQLRHIQHEMQVDSSMPWQAYWNEGSRYRSASPKVENSCRNVLAQQLKARLAPFGINIPPMSEAQLARETRVDVLILNGAGANLPIEIKRHFHPQVWQAATTQLQGYAANPGASGLGIFLVFWFGPARQTPARGKGKAKPTTAAEMEAMLRDGLPEHLRDTTDVVVLDVSDPRATSQRVVKARTPKKSPAKAQSTRTGKAVVPVV